MRFRLGARALRGQEPFSKPIPNHKSAVLRDPFPSHRGVERAADAVFKLEILEAERRLRVDG